MKITRKYKYICEEQLRSTNIYTKDCYVFVMYIYYDFYTCEIDIEYVNEICSNRFKFDNLTVINNTENDCININYRTKDESKINNKLERKALNLLYQNIEEYIKKQQNSIKKQQNILNESGYYREKKLKRILK